jgi:exopolyphosphatase / guanosine-5'-triphosphate,3'-diphosphate pyrophosphatase
MRAAVIGIGSNSLRLLVADRQHGQLTAILRDREGLRVFASLDAQNNIAANMIRSTCDSVTRMKRKSFDLGADEVLLFATSAVRDAKNQQALTEALLLETGLALDICSGELEAKLSFIGATESVRSGMIDIGGGSTEIVIGERETIDFSVSLQAGAVRLFRNLPAQCASDAHRVKDSVISLIQPYLLKIKQLKTPTVWVGVGGTMTAAATCIQTIDWNASEGIHGFTAKQREVKHAMETLADLPHNLRTRLRSIPPDRADILVHGLAILLGCMEVLGIAAVTVSERTNLDGYLKLFTADE